MVIREQDIVQVARRREVLPFDKHVADLVAGIGGGRVLIRPAEVDMFKLEDGFQLIARLTADVADRLATAANVSPLPALNSAFCTPRGIPRAAYAMLSKKNV